jgi:hypothetical protein
MTTKPGRHYIDGNEFYNGFLVLDSGRYWCIAQRTDGTYLRHYQGSTDQIFRSLNNALDDCGVMPE